MNNIEMKMDAIMRFLTAGNNQDREQALADMRSLMQGGSVESDPNPNKNVEDIVLDILTEMGVPAHIKGHDLMAAAIVAVIDDPNLKHNITGGLYPMVAKLFNTTKERTERAIRHAIEAAFDRCDIDVIEKYFGNTISLDKGKPTNGEFIAQIAMYVTRRMKNVA
jgi:two-component system response regulator (stage 0 sporulation protein A)